MSGYSGGQEIAPVSRDWLVEPDGIPGQVTVMTKVSPDPETTAVLVDRVAELRGFEPRIPLRCVGECPAFTKEFEAQGVVSEAPAGKPEMPLARQPHWR